MFFGEDAVPGGAFFQVARQAAEARPSLSPALARPGPKLSVPFGRATVFKYVWGLLIQLEK
jgi:hypothetical protein